MAAHFATTPLAFQNEKLHMISAGAAAAGTTRKQETIQRPHDTLRKSTRIAMK